MLGGYIKVYSGILGSNIRGIGGQGNIGNIRACPVYLQTDWDILGSNSNIALCKTVTIFFV